MSTARHHAEWLSLIEISGPFLSMPVLLRAFPQGLDADDADLAASLRMAYEEWLDNQHGLTPDAGLHRAWVTWVLTRLLGMDEASLRRVDATAAALSVTVAEHGETLRPDFAIVPPPNPFVPSTPAASLPHLLVQIVAAGQDLEKPMWGSTWQASPATRMMMLLHGTEIPVGLLTNGEQWMLVHARPGQTTGFVSWYAELWLEERLTLRAFRSLLGSHRFFSVAEDETLATLLLESVDDQHEVTDQLGQQVRYAVEVLIQAMDRADRKQWGALLQEIGESTLYEAAVTVMMRLVFLLSAEERGLLPVDDPLYAQHYAVSTLREQLHGVADQYGEALLERRHDAWCRLLAVFRAVHGGIHHDRLHLPAYGGSLFDPDRFRFLEGRTSPLATRTAQPLSIDNRTVLHLLDALQLLRVSVPGGGMETRRISFRALDIEQIGHVYEGLLDHTAKRAAATVLGLQGTSSKGDPEIPLGKLESLFSRQEALVDFLQSETGRSASALSNSLQADPPDMLRDQALRAACDNDEALYDRVRPFHGLIRDDTYGKPLIIPGGSLYVTGGTDRRASGAHYTPRSLTEPIVQHTLEPLVYDGPAQGKPKEAWRLRRPQQILELKICDMAMGSGAFLVQSCRYLAERLVEALEQQGKRQPAKGKSDGALALLTAAESDEERLTLARRLVADRCLYGVDKNPLAVEMAKLSLWLITLAKGRPFTFLDHALKAGDSLVGVDLEQLRYWSLHPDSAKGQGQQFAMLGIELEIQAMIAKRREIETLPVQEVADLQHKATLLKEADALAHNLKRAGDMLITSYYNDLKSRERESLRQALLSVARDGASLDEGWQGRLPSVNSVGEDDGADLRPFHWPLEFPEVFLAPMVAQQRAASLGQLTAADTLFAQQEDEGRTGFDAFVGNPPFIGGKRISSTLGTTMQSFIKISFDRSKGAADYVAYFFRRAFVLSNSSGYLGLIATNSISETDTRLVGLRCIIDDGGVLFRVESSLRWPGTAGVYVSIVHIAKSDYSGDLFLDGTKRRSISSRFDDMSDEEPYALKQFFNRYSEGVKLNGSGFVIDRSEYQELIMEDSRNGEVLQPYLNSEIFNNLYSMTSPPQYVINFRTWGIERAKKFAGPFQIVEDRVRKQREEMTGQIHEHRFWLHWDKRTTFFHEYRNLTHFLITPITSKYLTFASYPRLWFFSHAVKVFAFGGKAEFAVLQSSFHDLWTRRESSNLSTTLRYSTSDAFDTFAFPFMIDNLHNIGTEYHEYRWDVMQSNKNGMTDLYNRFHDPDESAADIVRLRQLHVEMDQAVAESYAWDDLALGHGFHETAQGVRFTISDEARREVLGRLLALNHARYAEEVEAGLHEKKGAKSHAKTQRPKGDGAEGQLGLF